ncbi:TCR/Tet family MFS transporter [Riemerella anatipestifer]|uniref:Tetracycline resistance protein, class C n=1 Tax=Riemerella anatipestifer TaxID=34085 RepID=A0A1S7DUG2_RIEAN|nr:TCR/Tet family MFS transporter [Riemerella anatipestifer]AQY22701.1 Tetracycline resistance protein, class C [Riemerella anatipestifer]MCO4303671.1 TCR/Tet family MFS transporter [Riemerella anatipestifer]MCO7352146.1 TCR/Tet family MFS transporter [Riemerella anatipestifer]MCQ4039680.1 TCR/Tet family MFS transporter [Riemerella anatipestifer]MCT6760659.1 TCR/Tet family MFS transporter [Riemerella anatipestifer]
MEKPHKSAAISFIFITLLIDITGWGIIIPVVPKLIEELISGDISLASKYGGWLSFAYAVMQFIFAPVLGNLSDQFGRRPVILFSLLGFSANFFLQAWAPSILWLFVGRLLSGITGASITTASAYIADISTEQDRSKNFGIIGAAFGLGFIIGPVLGGILGQFGARIPFLAAGILCLINFIYGFFILPESLSEEHRRKFNWKRANPIGSLLQLRKHPELYSLILAWFLVYIASHAVQTNWAYFGIYRFSWNETIVGISLGVMGGLTALVQGVILRKINPKIGNERSIFYGIGMYSIGMLLFSFAGSSWMMFAILGIYCLGGIAGPSLQSVISTKVSASEQGDLQGALTSIISLTSIIGPPLMTNIFYYFTHNDAPFKFAGAPFFVGFILMSVSTYIVYRGFYKNKK